MHNLCDQTNVTKQNVEHFHNNFNCCWMPRPIPVTTVLFLYLQVQGEMRDNITPFSRQTTNLCIRRK